MEVNITFIYEKRTISIQCKQNEGINSIYQKFVNKLNPNSSINDFDYFYEGEKLGKKIQNLKDFLQENQKDVNISVEKRTKVVKCPECICNDCMIDIDDYIIKFYGCKYKHVDYKIFDDYKSSQKIDFSKIFCKFEGCKRNESNNYEDFYKCLTCGQILKRTIYFCTFHKKEDEKKKEKHHLVNYDHKNFICNKHIKKFTKYCFKCRKDLCEDCEVDHKNHQIKEYDSMSPIVEEIKNGLEIIKGKLEILRTIVDYIKRNLLDGTMKIYENYCDILNDVIEKYELNNKEYKNYGVLKNFLNLKKSNKKILNDLEGVIIGDDYITKAYFLIDMFQKDLDNYKNLQKNIHNRINDFKKFFENKPDDLDDLMEWEGKTIETVKDKKNESPVKKKTSGKKKESFHNSKTKNQK